jgi:hypothetical protein
MRRLGIFVVAASVFVGGCQTIPKDALKLSSSSMEERQMQSRVYEDVTEEQILSSSVGIFQDLGAKITETETDLGLIVAEKNRDATEAGQIAAAVFLALLGGGNVAIDKEQKIKFSLVTVPATLGENDKRWMARLSIQRTVWNTNNQVSKIEAIRDPEIYQSFFDKMNKALFLEKNI